MTGEEYLDLDLATQEEMSNLGYELARMNNVNALDSLTQLFLDNGMLDDAERIQNLKNSAITYMQETIEEISGYVVNYNDITQQWIYGAGQQDPYGNNIGGQFAGKLSFERTLTDDEYEQIIRDKFTF
jgi:hypothetical protein